MLRLVSIFNQNGGDVMNGLFLRKIFFALLLASSLAGIFSSVACNTVHGVGEDIERGSDRVKRHL